MDLLFPSWWLVTSSQNSYPRTRFSSSSFTAHCTYSIATGKIAGSSLTLIQWQFWLAV